MTRSIFYGFGAFVGSLTGQTSCGWWPGDPATFNWDHTKLVPSNLAKTPQAVRDKLIAATAVEIDDHVTNGIPGLTEKGPMWPDGETIGATWLESTYWDKLAAGIKPDRIPAGMLCADYELTSVLYWDGALADRRFHGFHAHISQESGTNALCQIWPAGLSGEPGQNPAGTWWIDLATAAHPLEDGLTSIWTGTANKTGALFLDRPTVLMLSLRTPKLPKSTGADFFPGGE